LLDIDQFSIFFHWHAFQTVYDKAVIKDPVDK